MKESTKTFLSVLMVSIAILIGAAAIKNGHDERIRKENPENILSTNAGTVKLGRVDAELVATSIRTAVNGGELSSPDVFPYQNAVKGWNTLMEEAGVTDATMSKVDFKVCADTVVTYHSENLGKVDVKLMSECKDFPSGSMAGQMSTFLTNYTEQVESLYKNEFSFIKKGE